jgi:hypothetical protein
MPVASVSYLLYLQYGSGCSDGRREELWSKMWAAGDTASGFPGVGRRAASARGARPKNLPYNFSMWMDPSPELIATVGPPAFNFPRTEEWLSEPET